MTRDGPLHHRSDRQTAEQGPVAPVTSRQRPSASGRVCVWAGNYDRVLGRGSIWKLELDETALQYLLQH